MAAANGPSGFERLMAFACGIPERLWARRLMGMFAAYIDDSGSHKGDHLYVMGGYLASVQNWLDLAREWDPELDRLGLRGKGFHMADAEADPSRPEERPAPYDKWTAEDRDENVARFAGIAGRFAKRGIAVHMMWSDYAAIAYSALEAVGPAPEKLDRDVRDPLLILYQHSLYGVAKACDKEGIPHDEVELFYSDRRRTGLARDCAEHVWRELGFTEPSWKPMALFPGLQAADMIAWTIWKHTQPDGSVLWRPRHARLFDPPRTVGPINSENARRLAEKLRPYSDEDAP